jgi:DNA polymerase III subunit delta
MADNNQLLAAYLVVGPDELKRKQATGRLKTRADGPFAAFNLEEVQATADLEPQQLVSSLNSLPMGADRRFVFVYDAEKLPKAVSEAVISYLAAPNPACTLCLTATTLAKTTRLYKAVSKVGPKAIIDCSAKKARELGPYAQRLAQSHGVSIMADAVSELVSRVGESTKMLDTQIASLAALLGGSGTITRDFVEANVSRVAEVKPWEFLDRVSERDLRRSMELLALLEGNSQLGLLSLLTTRIRELICARSMAARGDARGVAAALRKADWQVKNHVRWANRFAEGELEHLLGECSYVERSLKSGGDGPTEMALLVTHVCGIR